MTAPERLWCLPMSGHLYVDPADLFSDEAISGPVTVEVWTVHDPIDHLPSDDTVAEWIAEWASENGEVDEGMSDAIVDASTSTPVLSALGVALRIMADRCGPYRMADKHVATYLVTPSPNVPNLRWWNLTWGEEQEIPA